MNNYDEELQRIKEKLKKANERRKALDDRIEKQMIVYENMSLDEIISRLNKPGVDVISIDIKETAERDMQEFGTKTLMFYEKSKMKEYQNSEDYYFKIELTYNEEPMELDVYNKLFTLKSNNPDISFSDIYDDTKKNELDEMLSENKEESDTKGFQL